MGDHQAGRFLAVGVMIALFNAQKTGKGDHVSTSLYHAAVYTQSLMIMAAQYKDLGETYPIDRRYSTNPLNVAYKTKDDRFVMISMPPYDVFIK